MARQGPHPWISMDVRPSISSRVYPAGYIRPDMFGQIYQARDAAPGGQEVVSKMCSQLESVSSYKNFSGASVDVT